MTCSLGHPASPKAATVYLPTILFASTSTIHRSQSTHVSVRSQSRLLSILSSTLLLGFVYLRTVPDGLEDEALVDTLKLAHFWDIENLFQKLQQLLVAALDIHNWEFCKSYEALSVEHRLTRLTSRASGWTYQCDTCTQSLPGVRHEERIATVGCCSTNDLRRLLICTISYIHTLQFEFFQV
jgi:hypothetical protein